MALRIAVAAAAAAAAEEEYKQILEQRHPHLPEMPLMNECDS